MNVAVVGATGYGSAELIRILERHPHVTLTQLVSSSQPGEHLGNIFPHLSHLSFELDEIDLDALAEAADAVFFAAPAGVSSRLLPPLAERGLICIDLAGDFRLNGDTYQEWYGASPPPEPWLSQAAYGLSEWFPSSIRKADVIANPGCYPTAALMALAPLVQEGVLDEGTVIVDGKSGFSGAGRGVKQTSLFCEVNENAYPYKVGQHRHTPEMEQVASTLGNRKQSVLFTPQIVPMSRGILVTLYGRAGDGWSTSRLRELAEETYRDSYFVRVRGEGRWPRTKEVQGSNFCDISYEWDERTHTVIGIAAIDNLVKGAAGQAVQNLNLRMGWPETAGLEMPPQYP